jgi:hypothetical protein
VVLPKADPRDSRGLESLLYNSSTRSLGRNPERILDYDSSCGMDACETQAYGCERHTYNMPKEKMLGRSFGSRGPVTIFARPLGSLNRGSVNRGGK